MPNAEEMITVSEAAELVDTSRWTIQRLARAGSISARQINARCWLVSKQDVMAAFAVTSPTLDGTPIARESAA